MSDSNHFWSQQDLDSIEVPHYCNLPESEVQRIKEQWLGKPVMDFAGIDKVGKEEIFRWKQYLPQKVYDNLSVELGYQILSDSD